MANACPSCGTSNPDSNRFCTNCGLSLAASPPEATPSLPQPPPADARKVCEGCRTVNAPMAAYCYRCGLKLPDRLFSPSEAVGNPAGFWVRLAAYMIDAVVLMLVGLALAIAAGALEGVPADKVVNQWAVEFGGWVETVVALALDLAYFTFAVGRWGRTAGKAILGLKITRADGSRLSYRRSFARYWSYLVSAIPLGFGFIAIALSSQKRGWHDFMCDTRVVNIRT